MSRLFALVVLVTGCIQSGLVPCGDQLCPVGTTCVADLCASPEQITACEGLADADTCTIRGGIGVCEHGVCVPTGCGNGVIDPDEVCDDGNATSGDGCRSDCKKIEMCGDGIVDEGEACDDGNDNAADGCDACARTQWLATAIGGGSTSAKTVGLASPYSVAVDLDGNLYVADSSSNRIRKVDPGGFITTIAGTGTAAFSGDGGAATSAELSDPTGVAVDGLGNVYIGDTANNRVRRIDPDGIITTIAGTGVSGTSGDGGDARGADVAGPQGLAVDGLGNLFIACTRAGVVRRIDPTGIITTVAGGGASNPGDGGLATDATLLLPSSVAVDTTGNLYIADLAQSRVRRVTPAGVISTIAGDGSYDYTGDGGPATSATLNTPAGVAVDAAGNVYIAEEDNQTIRRIAVNGIISTVAGGNDFGFSGDGGPATSAQLDFPDGVAVDPMGNIYVADTLNNRIRKFTVGGTISTFAGSGTAGFTGDGGSATSAQLVLGQGLALDASGNLYLAENGSCRVRKISPAGIISTIAGTGEGGYAGDGEPATAALLDSPASIAVDANGNVFVSDRYDSVIRRIDTSGIITTFAGTGLPGFSGDGGPAADAQLANPVGLAFDSAGNLYVADQTNQRIRKVSTTGTITTVAGTGVAGYSGDGVDATTFELNFPEGITVDAAGNLYIADSANARVRKVSGGAISTVAGTGVSGFSGDGGAATSARLLGPLGVAVDSSGVLYIADQLHVRSVSTAGIISTVTGGAVSAFKGDGDVAVNARVENAADVQVRNGVLFISDKNHIRRISSSGVITTIAGAIDPEGTGPLAQARLAFPRALAVTPAFTLFAGGASGTVQLARGGQTLEGAIGRYPQSVPTGALARFRGNAFGTVSGIAYDAAASKIYFTESDVNKIHAVTIVDPSDVNTWTIGGVANSAGIAGFSDGAAASARFRAPTGLYLDDATRTLYVADTGNHVIRAIDLASSTVRTVAGTPATRGFDGDGGDATSALLYAPEAVTLCPNGDLFIADTGNQRIRRVAAGSTTIATVLGDGVAAASGDGSPSTSFSVDKPLGLACDTTGNLYVTSTSTVRLLASNKTGVIDGMGPVATIYGAPPRDTFPASVTRCLTGIAVIDPVTLQVVDSCAGLLVQLVRQPVP